MPAIEEQELKSVQNAIAGVHVAIMCLEEELGNISLPNKLFIDTYKYKVDLITQAKGDTLPISTSKVATMPTMLQWPISYLVQVMTAKQAREFRVKYFKYWTGGQTVEGKICSFPFKLVTNGGVVSPLLDSADLPTNPESFDKCHTTVDLDKITKIGVLTQISTNDSVNKIFFYENDCISHIASAYGWSVSEPNLI